MLRFHWTECNILWLMCMFPTTMSSLAYLQYFLIQMTLVLSCNMHQYGSVSVTADETHLSKDSDNDGMTFHLSHRLRPLGDVNLAPCLSETRPSNRTGQPQFHLECDVAIETNESDLHLVSSDWLFVQADASVRDINEGDSDEFNLPWGM